ncbi:phage tail tape measure protein, partial [Bacillus thuringiensis]|nr:phage tail tape measure protein [Bacillus thuringiensis]
MELFKMFGSIFLKDDQLQRGLANAERSGQRTTGILGRGFGQVGAAAAGLGSSVGGAAIAMGGLVGIAVGVGAAVAGVVHVGSEYTKQMSKVEALSRSNGLQMAELGANARKLGADTRWSATNVAEAYEYMALAGWDSNQMIAASKPLLDLATAGALDLAKASDIVTDTMTPFGMKASEAGRAADVFALAQATANLNVEQLGETMKYAAPVAATFGLNIEQTAAIAQIFANNGIKASMAGTA